MQFLVYFRTNGPAETVDLLQVLIQLYCTNLNDLKGYLPILRSLAITSLIPFKIHNYIIHAVHSIQTIRSD